MSELKLLNIAQVCEKTSMSKSTVYRRMETQLFPQSVAVGTRNVAWLEHEVDEWIVGQMELRKGLTYNGTELDTLRNRIIEAFGPYWRMNDPAHRLEHFLEVERCGNHINTTLGLGFDPKLILYVAYFHDLFAWSRVNHHRMSHVWILSTNHPLIAELTDDERHLVASGCFYHRASTKDEPPFDFARLMCAADRGFPNSDTTNMLKRAIDFHTVAEGPVGARAAAIKHLKEKFGTGGYARYPDFYTRTFGEALVEQRLAVDALTV